MGEPSKEKFRFENLDSIRSLAFLSTFLAHAFFSESPQVLNSAVYKFAIKFQDVFSFGVPVFFVLSGFLISYLMLKEQEQIGVFSLKKFYMRRILRIWPVYFIVLIIGFIIFPIVKEQILHQNLIETANPLYYVAFLSNFDQMQHATLPIGVGLGPTWSVSIEEQFYVFWPLLFLFFKRKKFYFPIIAVILISIILTTIYTLPRIHTIFSMTYLGVGAAYAYMAFYYKSSIEKIVFIHPAIFLCSLITLGSLLYLTTVGYVNMGIITLIAINIGYLIVYQCYALKFQLRRIPFLEKWGKYTYGLYLYHVVCNFIVHIVIDDIMQIQDSVWIAVLIRPILALALSLLASYLSYTYIEKFFLNLKRHFAPKKIGT